MTVWNPDNQDGIKHWQPWQYETLTAMTVRNPDSQDSMKHWHPWQYETLAPMTVWNLDSQESMKHWHPLLYETLTPMTVWNHDRHEKLKRYFTSQVSDITKYQPDGKNTARGSYFWIQDPFTRFLFLIWKRRKSRHPNPSKQYPDYFSINKLSTCSKV